ncbi:MAG: DUF3313 domain-containing protein [Myxococcales bacterium]|nr:DUF3313 domain-containing protein [Myxococcales bacterium]MDH5565264.1 DUF3313 domain-containing protein [Myxococcales bacterium]
MREKAKLAAQRSRSGLRRRPRAASGGNPWTRGIACCALALGIGACATTEPAQPLGYSGFLRDYSLLTPRQGSDGAALSYVKPGARLGSYDRVLIDPVVVYYGVGTALHDLPREDLETLANHLYAAMVRHLESDYTLVQRPGSGVLRVQVALTEARRSDVVLNTLSSALPIRPISELKRLTTGTQAFVGSAGIEARIVDAPSDTLLVAVVDRRQGGKRLEGVDESWSDVLGAFEYWADQLQRALAEARAAEAR